MLPKIILAVLIEWLAPVLMASFFPLFAFSDEFKNVLGNNGGQC